MLELTNNVWNERGLRQVLGIKYHKLYKRSWV